MRSLKHSNIIGIPKGKERLCVWMKVLKRDRMHLHTHFECWNRWSLPDHGFLLLYVNSTYYHFCSLFISKNEPSMSSAGRSCCFSACDFFDQRCKPEIILFISFITYSSLFVHYSLSTLFLMNFWNTAAFFRYSGTAKSSAVKQMLLGKITMDFINESSIIPYLSPLILCRVAGGWSLS